MHVRSKRIAVFAIGLLALAGAAAPALAHPGHPGHETLGAAAGFAHPFSGVDHLLAMTAVGLWAARRGGRALVAWPAAFLIAMAAGFALGGGFSSAWLEAGVLATVVALGGLTALDRRAPEPAALAMVGAAGALHGMAHAADVGGAGSAFALGMLAATALLHGAGLGAGLALRRFGRPELVRLMGASVAAGGLVLAVAG